MIIRPTDSRPRTDAYKELLAYYLGFDATAPDASIPIDDAVNIAIYPKNLDPRFQQICAAAKLRDPNFNLLPGDMFELCRHLRETQNAFELRVKTTPNAPVPDTHTVEYDVHLLFRQITFADNKKRTMDTFKSRGYGYVPTEDDLRRLDNHLHRCLTPLNDAQHARAIDVIIEPLISRKLQLQELQIGLDRRYAEPKGEFGPNWVGK
jgi:hypothetical protein